MKVSLFIQLVQVLEVSHGKKKQSKETLNPIKGDRMANVEEITLKASAQQEGKSHYKCHRTGHVAKCCRSRTKVDVMEEKHQDHF